MYTPFLEHKEETLYSPRLVLGVKFVIVDKLKRSSGIFLGGIVYE
jgi:hypothetical protein